MGLLVVDFEVGFDADVADFFDADFFATEVLATDFFVEDEAVLVEAEATDFFAADLICGFLLFEEEEEEEEADTGSATSTSEKPRDLAKLRAAPLRADLVGNCVLPSERRANLVGFSPAILTVPSYQFWSPLLRVETLTDSVLLMLRNLY